MDPKISNGRMNSSSELKTGPSFLLASKPLSTPVKIFILTFFYFAAGKFGLSLAVVHASASAVWPPTGIAIAAFLIFDHRVWPAILIGAFLVNVTTAGSVLTSFGIAAGNTLEGLLGAYLVKRFAGGLRVFDRPQDVFKFLFLASMLSTVVSPTLGVTTLALGGFASWNQYLPIWFTWWMGDLVGSLLFAPLFVLWYLNPSPKWESRKFLELTLSLALLFLVAQIAFNGIFHENVKNYPLAFLCIPVLVWIAFRFSPREAAFANLILCGVALWGTLKGFGPFVLRSKNESLLLLQAFMGVMSLMSLCLAALVSELRRAGAANASLAAIVESSDDAIIGKTLEGVITSWNKGAQRVYGYSAEEVIGKPVAVLVPQERQSEIFSIFERIKKGGWIEHYETARIRKDGQVITVSLTISPIKDASGRVVGASTIARDITESKRAQENLRRVAQDLSRSYQELDRSSHELKKANERLQKLDKLKTDFISAAAHELRTPLTSIKGYVSLMIQERTGRVNPDQKEFLGYVKESTDRLHRLLNDMLDLSKIESGRLSMKMEPVDLSELLKKEALVFKPQAEAKKIRMRIELESSFPPVYSDADTLRQAVDNLIHNAIKYTPANGDIHIRARRTPEAVEIEIQDSGVGIKEEFLSVIFEPFQRVQEPGRQQEGTGLGLTLVKKIVEAHGGRVSVQSKVGTGSVFKIELPTMKPPLKPEDSYVSSGL